MRIEAVFDHGRIELPAGIAFRHPRFRVAVIVPDDELAGTEKAATPVANSPGPAIADVHPEPDAPGKRPIREAIDEMLGPWKTQLRSGPPLEDGDIDRLRHQALREKHLEYR